jgi:hypothetical protein
MIAHFSDVAQELMRREGEKRRNRFYNRKRRRCWYREGKKRAESCWEETTGFLTCALQLGQLLHGHGSSFPRASISPYERSASLSFFLSETGGETPTGYILKRIRSLVQQKQKIKRQKRFGKKSKRLHISF